MTSVEVPPNFVKGVWIMSEWPVTGITFRCLTLWLRDLPLDPALWVKDRWGSASRQRQVIVDVIKVRSVPCWCLIRNFIGTPKGRWSLCSARLRDSEKTLLLSNLMDFTQFEVHIQKETQPWDIKDQMSSTTSQELRDSNHNQTKQRNKWEPSQ